MKIRFSFFITLFITCSMWMQITYCDAKYISMQINTDQAGFVQSININTVNLNSSITLRPSNIDTSIKDAAKAVGLIKDQPNQTVPHAWFTITPQGGLIFDYTRNAPYDAAIGRITNLVLKQNIQDVHTAFQKYLEVVDKALGVNVHAELPGDITLKNSPYSAPARAMYKEMRKLALAVGITLPDPDYSLLRTCFKWGLAATLLAGSAYFLYSNWGQLPGAIGTKTEQCGTGVETFGKGISATGGGVEATGRGIKGVGTWFKTPRSPKAKTGPAPQPMPSALSTPATPTMTVPDLAPALQPTLEPSLSVEVPVSQTLQLTPTPEIFQNTPVSPNIPTP